MAERTGVSERPRAAGWRVWLLWMLASTVGWVVGGVMFVPVVVLAGTALDVLVGWAVAGAVGGAVVGAGSGWCCGSSRYGPAGGS